MNRSKEMRFYAVLIILLLIAGLWFPVKYAGNLRLNLALSKRGHGGYAEIIKKGVLMDGRLKSLDHTKPSDHHAFNVRIEGIDRGAEICQVNVSKRLYEEKAIGDRVLVTYLPEDPSVCQLPLSIASNTSFILFGFLVSFFFLLLVLILIFFLLGSYRKNEHTKPITLSNRMDIEAHQIVCPNCHQEMREGYIPVMGAIPWRSMDEPVGLPTIFSGLPGTIFWFRRPKLHAFHCKKCRIVIFKYGKS